MESAMRRQYSPISLARKDVRGDMMSSKRIKNSSTKTLRAPNAQSHAIHFFDCNCIDYIPLWPMVPKGGLEPPRVSSHLSIFRLLWLSAKEDRSHRQRSEIEPGDREVDGVFVAGGTGHIEQRQVVVECWMGHASIVVFYGADQKIRIMLFR